MDDDFFFDKCHGSWVGKVTGSTYGMPFEGKNPRWLAKTYKQVAGWQKRHGAGGGVINDDEQFELVALICLEQEGYDAFTVDMLARYWAEYLNPKFIFTAEKQVVENWAQGVPPAESALPANNPWWDFIGAQMKGELFGQLAPGNLEEATRLAKIDGAVAHHGIGVDGEVFVACMVSQGMVSSTIPTRAELADHIRVALDHCTPGNVYVDLMEHVLAWSAGNPEPLGWKTVFEKVENWWREEILPVLIDQEESAPTHPERKSILMSCAMNPWGVCHVLPNAGIVAIALLYGAGDFGQSLQIAAMMGYDADCNVGNCGGILGAYYGYELVPDYWRSFTKDEILAVVRDWEDPSLSHLAERVLGVSIY
ncbi:MAG TPA: ADP-ribosylglycohydrolase family protein [Candidatus Lokiarchaeia archaeon]|nr:ADP-ribosylglycohydrolase family protein [Candidatus Lokiarchaeia archaeon]